MPTEKLKQGAQQVAEVVASHPKTASVVVAATTGFNVWFATYEPIFRFITTVLGILILLLVFAKHAIDVVKSYLEVRAIMKETKQIKDKGVD